jgi:hypothetical protein
MPGGTIPSRSAPAGLIASAISCSIILAGCFTTSDDYQSDAKQFILTDEDLRAELFPAGGSATQFSSAVCEDPQSQDPGTTFTCNAQDDAGRDWVFEITIEDSNGYSVNVSRRPTG